MYNIRYWLRQKRATQAPEDFERLRRSTRNPTPGAKGRFLNALSTRQQASLTG